MSRRRQKNWFTIVATDLFSGSFAAILMIDAITPKEIGSVPNAQYIEISYEKTDGMNCPAPDDGAAIIFSFFDSGDPVTTIDSKFIVRSTESRCIVAGVLEIYLEQPPSNTCVIISELAGPKPKIMDVSIAALPFDKQIEPDVCP